MSHAITVSNGGSGATKNIHFTVEKDLADKVAFIEATAGSASDKTYLRVSETKLSSNKVGAKLVLKTSNTDRDQNIYRVTQHILSTLATTISHAKERL